MVDAQKIIADAIERETGIGFPSATAKQVLSALHSSGLKVLGREPTIEMEKAGLANAKAWWPSNAIHTEREHLFLWSAMFDAALPATQGGER